MKTAVFSAKKYDRRFLDKFNRDTNHELTYFETSLNPKTARLAAEFEAVCVFVNDQVNRETIVQLSRLGIKIIALRCAGFNNVDIAAASECNIKVVRVPAYSPRAVAEYALALIFTLNRKTHKAYNRVREGNFSLDGLLGFTLFEKTVGVVGTGQIGSVFCEIMMGFGCRLLAFDKYESDSLKAKGVAYVSFDDLLAKSDVISLHCPLTPETHHLINAEAFSKMKTGAMLINTSRGGVIDTEAAMEALKNEKLGYLGIDVYEQEENLFFKDLSEVVIRDDKILRLMSYPNVLISSHQGFFTEEALDQISSTTLNNLSDFETGKELKNQVGVEMVK